MRRRTFVTAAGTAAAAVVLRVAAQPAKPVPRVSFISHSSPKAYGHMLQAFRDELRALGYVVGRNIQLDLWWAENRLDRLPSLIAEALSTKPAVIVTHGSPGVAALQKATSTVPIVFAAVGDPVGQGFVRSYRNPGANITGVAFNDDVNWKVYELIKIVMPGTSRVATLINPDNPASRLYLRRVPPTVKKLGLENVMLEATRAEDLAGVFADASKAQAQVLMVSTTAPFVFGLLPELVVLQFKHRLPLFFSVPEGSQAGGLAGYGFPQEENYRRAAALVDKILKGARPAELAVEIPTRYEITINLKTARALGIKVPESALLRADKVIPA